MDGPPLGFLVVHPDGGVLPMFLSPFAFVQGIGLPELLIVLGIVLLIFGPKRLPMLGRQLGSGMKEFKDSVTGKSGDDEDEVAPVALATPPVEARTAEPVEGEVVPERRDP